MGGAGGGPVVAAPVLGVALALVSAGTCVVLSQT